MKLSILPKSPLQISRPHPGLWGVLTVIGLIIRVALKLADHYHDYYNGRRD